MNPLFRMALLKGSLTSVLLHVRRGTPVNDRDGKGLTPLMLAAAAGRAEVCRLLLEEGADASALQSGRTAADMARHAGHLHLAQVLKPVPPPVHASTITISAISTPAGELQAEPDGWEAEEVFQAASTDATVFSVLIETQAAISSAGALNSDTDWLDVAIELPAMAPMPGSESCERALRMIQHALRDPLVGWPNLAKVVRRLPGSGALLEDLGISTITTDFETTLFAGSEPPVTFNEDAGAEIGEAIEALRVWRPATELYQVEVARLAAPDRSAEQSMFRALREAKRQVLIALLHALPLAAHSLGSSTVQGDKSENWSDEASEEGSPNDVEEVSEQSLTAALKAVRGGSRKADAETMISLDLDPRVVTSFDAALAGIKGGEALREHLASTTAKYLRIRDRVTEANLLLVSRYAARSMRPGVLLEDLIQDGSIGLMRAVERFDVSRGNRFMTYAAWWIRQACGRAAEDHARTIRVPVHINEQIQRIDRARTQMTNRLGRRPRADELAATTGVSLAKAARLDSLRHRTVSMEAPDIRTLISRMTSGNESSPFDSAVAKEHQRIIARAMERLTPRQEHVLRSRYGFSNLDEQTLEEVGTKMSLTRERIRQIEAKALLKLQSPSNPKNRQLRALL